MNVNRREFLQLSLVASAFTASPLRVAAAPTALSPEAVFQNPPRAFAPIPWWLWNGDMDLGEMERQILEIADCGARGFYIFPMTGLRLEYLGEDYMDRVRWAVQRAVELGLEPWIYEDFDWPTGLAKDRVIQRQELRQRAVFAAIRSVEGPSRVVVPIPEGEVIAAAAAPRGGDELCVARTVDLTERCDGRELTWESPSGRWDVFVFVERVVEGASFVHYYVDTFNAETTRYFIELTYDAYRRSLGSEHFGHVRGFFADEAFFLNRYSGTPSETSLPCAPWSSVVRDALGTAIPTTLVAVFGDADRFGRHLRREFHGTTQRLYKENFYRQRADWCKRHGKVLTGHEGGWITGGGDFARTLSAMQMPGMDWLGLGKPEHARRMLEAKVVSSLARHRQRPAMMEGPGLFTWRHTMRELRQSCDAFALYGFQSFTFNSFHYTVEGKRYYCPSVMFYQSPHWPLMPSLVRYCTRLVWALQQGRVPAHVAVLWTPETVWSQQPASAGQPPREGQRIRRPEDDWQRGVEAVMAALMGAQIDFGVLDTATLLEQATVTDDGELSIAAMKYEIVIVPPTQSLSLDVAQKLAAFHTAGGKLIAVGALPTESEQPKHDKLLLGLMTGLFGSDAWQKDWSTYKTGNAAAGVRVTGPRSWFVTANWNRISEQIAEPLRTTVAPLAARAWTLTGESAGRVFATERLLPDGQFLFLVNASDESSAAELRLRDPSQIDRWDLLSGRTEPWPQQDSALTGKVNLLPRESLLLKLRPTAAWRQKSLSVAQCRRLPDRWRFHLIGGNAAFPTPHWETSERPINVVHTMGYGYQVQFTVREKPERLALLIDNADERFHSERVRCGYDCTLNGQTISKLDFNQTFDRRMRQFDLTELVHKGVNLLKLEYRHCSWLGAPVLPSLSLIGLFAIEKGQIVPATKRETPAVSWTELGYPYFSGAAVYAQEFEWGRVTAKSRVWLRMQDIRDHARIRLNGQLAAELPWPPWEADITPLLRPGRNELEIEVINTNANFVTRDPAPSGLIGAVTLAVLDETT